MADFNSSLPIRSEADGVDAKVIVKVTDGTPGGSNQMSVDADKNAHVEVHGNRADDAADVALQLSEEGRPNPRGDYEADENSKPASAAQILHSRQASPDETHQTFRPTGVASSDGSNAKAADVALRDEAGNAFTPSNPLPVAIADSEGDEINDFNTASAVAAGGTSNHDYTVTASTVLKLSQIHFSASGKMKVEVQIEDGVASDSFDTVFVGFNSTAKPSDHIPVAERISVAAGVRVRVIRTNKDNQAQDLYTTICGAEIAA